MTCPWHARPLVGRRRRGRDPAAQPAPSWEVPRPPRLAQVLTDNSPCCHDIFDFCVPQLTSRPRIQCGLLHLFSVVSSAFPYSVWFTPRPRIQCGLLRVLGFSVVYSASSDSVWLTPRPRIQCGLLRVLGFSEVYSASSDSVRFTPRPRIQCGLLRAVDCDNLSHKI